MAGALLTTATGALADATPPLHTTTAAGAQGSETGTPHGACRLIWFGLTNWMGAAMPLMVTPTPPTVVESDTESASAMLLARFDPKMETSEPGAIAGSEGEPAVVTTPFWLMTGGSAANRAAAPAQIRRAG